MKFKIGIIVMHLVMGAIAEGASSTEPVKCVLEKGDSNYPLVWEPIGEFWKLADSDSEEANVLIFMKLTDSNYLKIQLVDYIPDQEFEMIREFIESDGIHEGIKDVLRRVSASRIQEFYLPIAFVHPGAVLFRVQTSLGKKVQSSLSCIQDKRD